MAKRAPAATEYKDRAHDSSGRNLLPDSTIVKGTCTVQYTVWSGARWLCGACSFVERQATTGVLPELSTGKYERGRLLRDKIP